MKRSQLIVVIVAIAALMFFPVGIQNPYYIHLPEQHDRVDHDRLEQVDVVGVADRDREQQQHGHAGDREQKVSSFHPGHTFLITLLPNSPCGRTASTISSSTRPGTSL